MSPRISKGLQWAKTVLFFVGVFAGGKAFFALGSVDPGKNLALALVLFVSYSLLLCPLVFLLGWLIGSKEKSESGSLSSQCTEVTASIEFTSNDVSEKKDKIPNAKNNQDQSTAGDTVEDRNYEIALLEVDSGKVIPGLWGRAFANADGDINKAKASYIKARVLQLSSSSADTDTFESRSAVVLRNEHHAEASNLVALKPDQWQCEKCQEVHENKSDECSNCAQEKHHKFSLAFIIFSGISAGIFIVYVLSW